MRIGDSAAVWIMREYRAIGDLIEIQCLLKVVILFEVAFTLLFSRTDAGRR